jgi:peptide/nickel transport system substrate-binding protein
VPQEPYTYDPALARRLLAEAGHPNGFSTSLMWQTGHGPQIRQFAQTFISYRCSTSWTSRRPSR